MNKKMLFIYNMHAGKAQIKNHLADILDIFTKSGYDVTVHPTQANKDAYFFIRDNADNYDIVTVGGGDGTLTESVEGMMEFEKDERKVMGYIPAGTTNDFAYTLSIPKNMIDAANVIVDGKVQQYDIGCFNGKTYNYVAAFGAFTNVSYETPQTTKNLLGHAAYVFEGMKSLNTLKSYHMKVTCDGKTIEDDIFLGFVMNSYSVAGIQLNKKDNIELNDGLFEVLLLKKPTNIIELISLMQKGRADSEAAYFMRGSNIKFEIDEPVKWTLDGEFGGEEANVNIDVIKSAMKFIVPK